MDEVTRTLIALSGQENVVVVRKPFVKFTDSLEGGLLLGQLLYWTPRAQRPDGFVAKSDVELCQELCLKRHRLRRARNDLETMGILETALHRFKGAPTTHYRLDLGELHRQWIMWIQTIDCLKSDNPSFEIAQCLTETTPEIAPKKDCPADAGGEQQSFAASLVKASKKKNGRPPSVDVYREGTHLWPKKPLWKLIDGAVGTDQGDLDFWFKVVLKWVALGRNPMNVDGMLEHFRERRLPAVKRGKGALPRGRSITDEDRRRYVTGEFADRILS